MTAEEREVLELLNTRLTPDEQAILDALVRDPEEVLERVLQRLGR